jgi:hypothetical protein
MLVSEPFEVMLLISISFFVLFLADKTCQIHTNAAYNDCCKAFMKRDKIRGRGLRVLALFSGIGSETVVL